MRKKLRVKSKIQRVKLPIDKMTDSEKYWVVFICKEISVNLKILIKDNVNWLKKTMETETNIKLAKKRKKLIERWEACLKTSVA